MEPSLLYRKLCSQRALFELPWSPSFVVSWVWLGWAAPPTTVLLIPEMRVQLVEQRQAILVEIRELPEAPLAIQAANQAKPVQAVQQEQAELLEVTTPQAQAAPVVVVEQQEQAALQEQAVQQEQAVLEALEEPVEQEVRDNLGEECIRTTMRVKCCVWRLSSTVPNAVGMVITGC
jgi:hypothetical protein